METFRLSFDLEDVINVEQMNIFEVIAGDDSKNFAELFLFEKSFLIDAIPILLAFKHFGHLFEADIYTKFLLFSVEELHKFFLV